jgi:hypothetical protein
MAQRRTVRSIKVGALSKELGYGLQALRKTAGAGADRRSRPTVRSSWDSRASWCAPLAEHGLHEAAGARASVVPLPWVHTAPRSKRCPASVRLIATRCISCASSHNRGIPTFTSGLRLALVGSLPTAVDHRTPLRHSSTTTLSPSSSTLDFLCGAVKRRGAARWWHASTVTRRATNHRQGTHHHRSRRCRADAARCDGHLAVLTRRSLLRCLPRAASSTRDPPRRTSCGSTIGASIRLLWTRHSTTGYVSPCIDRSGILRNT